MDDLKIASFWKKYGKYLTVALFVIGAIIFAVNFDVEQFKVFLQKYEKYGMVASLFVYAVLGVTPIPSEPVTVFLLAWKGPVAAVVVATLGNTLAALVEFYIGGSIGEMADFEKKKEALPFRLGRMPIHSPVFLLLVRMLPGFGPKFVSIAGGIYKVPMFTYLWTTIVSNLMGAVLIVASGYGLIQLFQ